MMRKQMISGICFIVMVMLFSGCTTGTSTSIRTRSYIQEKDRVDQKMEGNFGYLFGDPVPEDRTDIKKTRSIYVLEFTKEDESEEEVDVYIPRRRPKPKRKPRVRRERRDPPPIRIPAIEDEEVYESHQASFVEYTVEKNDTLQKISKKYYDGYSKWKRIYNANKDVLANPNKIKEGMVLRIPLD